MGFDKFLAAVYSPSKYHTKHPINSIINFDRFNKETITHYRPTVNL